MVPIKISQEMSRVSEGVQVAARIWKVCFLPDVRLMFSVRPFKQMI